MKIVFSTPVGKVPDYFYTSVRRRYLRYSIHVPAFGLRFLRENVPGVEMLEYPNWFQFESRLKKGHIDILGISFYMKDGNTVLKMIKMARKYGVREIWGGNYGVLCDEIAEKFDRVFPGYAENDVRKALGLEKLPRIKHPPICSRFGLHLTPLKFRQGFLFTSRGCEYDCTFCQTHAFVPEASKMPLETIEDVLIEYRNMGVGFVFITDENFLCKSSHGEKVITLLEKYGFSWGAQTRIDSLSGRVKELRERGLFVAQIGIESFDPDKLSTLNKRTTPREIIETLESLKENDLYIHGSYMLGHEDDTEKSLRKDIRKLADMRIDSTQITITTPFPKTVLWNHISEKYGIFEKDYSKFDTYHLTWNHPHLSREKLHYLMDHAWMSCFTFDHMYSGFRKAVKHKIPRKMLFGPIPKPGTGVHDDEDAQ